MLYINDIFYSIQGESSFAGYPCLFIRLSGCNINCSYCDTKEALTKENSKMMDIEEIIKELSMLARHIRLVEITGGEPLIQNDVYDLFKNLIKLNYQVLLETNGTVSLKDVPEEVIKIVDIKCPSSGYSSGYNNYINLDYINENDEIKFVIGTDEDYEFAKDFLKNSNIKAKKIIFSPIRNKFAPEELAGKMLKDELNARLGLQIHKILNLK